MNYSSKFEQKSSIDTGNGAMHSAAPSSPRGEHPGVGPEVLEMLSAEHSRHSLSIGRAVMPHGSTSRDPLRFYAREGGDPLTEAFDGKISVHPGMGGIPVTGAAVSAMLEGLSRQSRAGKKLVYIHVPFCEIRCLYCSFFQKAYSSELGAAYTDMLIRELSLWKGREAQDADPVNAVYLGGGTPTALAPKDLSRLLAALHEFLPLSNDCEITLEGRTSDLVPERIEAALAGGVNRFSLGVQTFDTKIRRSMGRRASREELAEHIRLLQSYRQAAVVVDLIYGLPRQSMDIWLQDLATARELNLDGMDCYQLGVHRNSPLAKAIAAGKMPPAADTVQLGRMFAEASRVLENAHYRRLSIEHWGRTPHERNIYNIYTKSGASCLGFGPGAGGLLNGCMTYNTRDYDAWRAQVEEGRKPVAMLLAPVALSALNKALTESLEQGYIDVPMLEKLCVEHEYATLSGKGELAALVAPLLDQWRGAGLLEKRDSFYSLTLAGQFWYVNLNQLLIEYIEECAGAQGAPRSGMPHSGASHPGVGHPARC